MKECFPSSRLRNEVEIGKFSVHRLWPWNCLVLGFEFIFHYFNRLSAPLLKYFTNKFLFNTLGIDGKEAKEGDERLLSISPLAGFFPLIAGGKIMVEVLFISRYTLSARSFLSFLRNPRLPQYRLGAKKRRRGSFIRHRVHSGFDFIYSEKFSLVNTDLLFVKKYFIMEEIFLHWLKLHFLLFSSIAEQRDERDFEVLLMRFFFYFLFHFIYSLHFRSDKSHFRRCSSSEKCILASHHKSGNDPI